MTRLSRAGRHAGAAPPIRHVHLGLGNFFRAHQATYTHRADDGERWGIAAFTGRSAPLATAMAEQDGLYTLIVRSSPADRFEVISSVSRAYSGSAADAWVGHLRSRDTAIVSLTVTEAAYRRSPTGGLDAEHPAVRADLDALAKSDLTAVTTVPGRLVAGLIARRAADAGPLAIVSCDNLANNGDVVERIVRDMAVRVDETLAEWVAGAASFPVTMVDRITPRATDDDRARVVDGLGVSDHCPVVTEPFSEWVLQDRFPAGRPAWDGAGAVFTDDVAPYERRKLWLLNGAHSLLAYAGIARGHATVADAVRDDRCLGWVHDWWDTACRHLDLPETELRAYRESLSERFANPAMRHLLAQIAADGSEKLRVRTAPVVARERARGVVPLGATRTLAAWLLYLRGDSTPVVDANADEVVALASGRLSTATQRVLDFLDPELGSDAVLCAAVETQAEELSVT